MRAKVYYGCQALRCLSWEVGGYGLVSSCSPTLMNPRATQLLAIQPRAPMQSCAPTPPTRTPQHVGRVPRSEPPSSRRPAAQSRVPPIRPVGPQLRAVCHPPGPRAPSWEPRATHPVRRVPFFLSRRETQFFSVNSGKHTHTCTASLPKPLAVACMRANSNPASGAGCHKQSPIQQGSSRNHRRNRAARRGRRDPRPLKCSPRVQASPRLQHLYHMLCPFAKLFLAKDSFGEQST